MPKGEVSGAATAGAERGAAGGACAACGAAGGARRMEGPRSSHPAMETAARLVLFQACFLATAASAWGASAPSTAQTMTPRPIVVKKFKPGEIWYPPGVEIMCRDNN